ncbi:MAG: twin arginine-targeting protein translocase TatC [Halothiobacillus sp. 24-54-40]|nr:MAG: twin arginine-targeting protein translocase TatC [Halothiobacillus sp. 35-54-62]OYZ86931.1 MAG: twin arginine-targeting protein translocase TatC [Halothiobacillus sp. 24-54-40]
MQADDAPNKNGSNDTVVGSPEQEGVAGFLAHLVELRNRLLKSVLVVLVLFIVLFPLRNDLFTLLADPLSKHMPPGTTMIAVQVASPFFIPLKLTALTALFISIPFLLYQLWAFIAPGLYKHERKLVAPLVFSSTILFYLGAAFAYFAVFPIVFGFLAAAGPSDVNFAPDIGEYLSFVTSLFFAFGFVFEVPVAIVLLVIIGVVTPAKLAEFRRYAILIAFIIAAILTPPDVMSQFMMAIPIILLYEFGLFVSRFFYKAKMARAAALAAQEAEEDAARDAADKDDEVTQRHEAYEQQAASAPLDFDKALDEAEADQRRLEAPSDAPGDPSSSPDAPPPEPPRSELPNSEPTNSEPPEPDAPPKKPGDAG